MANYLLVAGGELDNAFPWSITGACVSSESESQVALAWNTVWASVFGDATFAAFIPPMTKFTFSSASTASATLHQTTKTETTDSVAGTSTSPAIAFNSATIITLRTSFATRWGRGRWYFPGLATNALATNGYNYSAAAMTALSNALTSALTTFTASAVLSVAHHNVIVGGPAQYSLTSVIGGDVSDQIARQGRRADKRLPLRTNWTL